MRAALLALLLTLLSLPMLAFAGGDYIKVEASAFRSVLKYDDIKGDTAVPAFEMMTTPVTDGEYLDFVRVNPQWQRDRVAPVYATRDHYLAQWKGPLELGDPVRPEQPVTNVSWFAVSAYCESQHARLPHWAEWELVAAADPTRHDARNDPAWRESILGWYARPATAAPSDVGQSPANVYGMRDINGLIWEWTEDFAAMLVSSDDRSQSDANRLKFCGAGALTTQDRENYAVLMRVAMLSSLEGADSTSSLGFRCVRDVTVDASR